MTVFLLCVKIFFCRILDVSLSTVRTIVTVKGKSAVAALIGFVEVTIWFLVVREALNTDETSIFIAIAYAGGFAAGTYIGGKLAGKYIKGMINLQVVTSKQDDAMVEAIRNAGYAVSVVNVNPSEYGEGKYMLFMEVPSAKQNELKALVHRLDEGAFIMVHETKYVYNGFFKQ